MQTLDKYNRAQEIISKVATMLLFAFVRAGSLKNKEIIIRNFIAKSTMSLKSIFKLYEIKSYQDCWSIHRCLIDRLFHLHSITKNNEFDVFDDWSFLLQYNAQNNARSDVNFNRKINIKEFTPNKIEKKRANNLQNNPPKWKRPDPEKIAKDMNLYFLYNYGYHFASSHIHPMASDGAQDFITLTGLNSKSNFPDPKYVLHNSIIIFCLIIREGLNGSCLSWRKIIFEFLDEIVNFLNSGKEDYLFIYKRLVGYGPNFKLCEFSNK